MSIYRIDWLNSFWIDINGCPLSKPRIFIEQYHQKIINSCEKCEHYLSRENISNKDRCWDRHTETTWDGDIKIRKLILINEE